ncbi:Cof-type HAD-IIB family hydrolase [Dactylosporangium darangshiense]|uniref:Cof-type HAD-IIB family hydrolase n=1 Tax=Dactylosporangium darangshiense TaxID=579108 RepID=A0ABP8DCP7_9ACTN
MNAGIGALLADVDGTLVTGDSRLTGRAVGAVRELQRRGVVFAITSGRPPSGLVGLVEPLGVTVPMAAFNGGAIVMPDMRVVDERTVPPGLAPSIVSALREHDLDVWVFHSTGWYLTDEDAPHARREARTVSYQPVVVTDLAPVLDRAVKIVGVGDDHDRVALAEADLRVRFGAHVTASRSQPHYLDVTHPSATKGVVVQRLSDYYGIPLEHIATIGDQPNDVAMFVRSGLSIAMGNAPEDVRRQATHVTASYEQEGFAEAVERYVLPSVEPRPGPQG